MKRRSFLTGMGSAVVLGAPGLSRAAGSSAPHVVVVGGGYGGATAAKYLRLFSKGKIRVTLIEPQKQFISCPISNLVLEGAVTIQDITHSYDHLKSRHGITIVHDTVTRIDHDARKVHLSNGDTLAWDRLVVSPGIDFMWNRIPGMNNPEAQGKILHAWKAGEQTVALRKQLEAMPDGGRFILSIPEAPYRCPPGPYERACMVASYFKKHKPRSKVLVFDANQDITSKKGLFMAAWKAHYADIIEYNPMFKAVDVDVAQNTVVFELGEREKADVLNLVPPMRAGKLAVDAGLATANDRWCEVDFLTFASVKNDRIHVLGDSIQVAPQMPKSGHMANQHGKNCAAAVTALLLGYPVNPDPIYANTCFSFVTDAEAMHVASVHRYSTEKKTMLPVAGSGGVSDASSAQEGTVARTWARSIWNDVLG
ncbi:MAG: FCSD flavin-binding domain-containing protein [Burkholderiaceae bacterium]|jgi:sulfide dehydrogenase [flavocytochrome c] flavoprotein subunit